VGCSIAPLAGGVLSKPAKRYPQFFSQHGLFGQFPYLLPCLLCVVFNVFSSIFCAVYMVESRNISGGGGGGGRDMKVGGGSVEMTKTSAVKFSIISHEDDDDDDIKYGDIEPGDENEEEKSIVEEDTEQKKLTLLQRIAAVSTPQSQKKGNYSKLSVTEDGNGDLTDTETLGESSTSSDLLATSADTSERAGRLGSGMKFSNLADDFIDDEDDENSIARKEPTSRFNCGLCCWTKSPAKSGKRIRHVTCCLQEKRLYVHCLRFITIALVHSKRRSGWQQRL